MPNDATNRSGSVFLAALLAAAGFLPACRDRRMAAPANSPAPAAPATIPVPAASAPAAFKRVNFFNSAGVRIAYAEAGSGDPVILVHGLYSSAAINWGLPGTFDLLAEHYHVIAFDLRGHGLSDKPTEDADYGQPMVEDLTRLMDHLNIRKAHIVGYSLGGIIVMKFLVDHPDRALSATLGGMGWLKDGSLYQGVFERLGGRNATAPAACMRGIARLAITESQVDAIKTPIHVLVGDQDPCKAMYVQPLLRIRPDIGVTEIGEAGHFTCIVKEDFKTGIAKWLAAQPQVP
jgi:pimeloyl-ACP methyl ester carboxylesterase